ncbi:MAG: hypothetical protein ACQESR_22865 [Planctomycetota bacterium]
MKSKPRRSLKNIRTMSERAGDAHNSQRKYLTLATLELKKSRCEKEKRSAEERLESVGRRMAEIERQQAGILATGEAELANRAAANDSALTPDPGPQTQQGFSLTY